MSTLLRYVIGPLTVVLGVACAWLLVVVVVSVWTDGERFVGPNVPWLVSVPLKIIMSTSCCFALAVAYLIVVLGVGIVADPENPDR